MTANPDLPIQLRHEPSTSSKIQPGKLYGTMPEGRDCLVCEVDEPDVADEIVRRWNAAGEIYETAMLWIRSGTGNDPKLDIAKLAAAAFHLTDLMADDPVQPLLRACLRLVTEKGG